MNHVVLLHRPRGLASEFNLRTGVETARRFGHAVAVLRTVAPQPELDVAMAAVAPSTVLVHADYERDQELAAAFRDRYDIPGPRPELITRFRDKTVMHETLRAQAPRAFALPACLGTLDDFSTLRDFAARHGHIILKPRSASGARDQYEITTVAELTIAWNQIAARRSEYRAEAFIETEIPEFHVDSIVYGGQVLISVPAQYTYPPNHLTAAGTLPGSITHAHDHDPLCERVRAANVEAIRLLGFQRGITHAEFFVRNGEVIFGEIAARMGGGPIRQMFREVTGIDLCEAAIEMYCDPHFSDALHARVRFAPHEIGALLHTTVEAGTIARITTPPAISGSDLLETVLFRDIGDRLLPPAHSADAVGFSLVRGSLDTLCGALHALQEQWTIELV